MGTNQQKILLLLLMLAMIFFDILYMQKSSVVATKTRQLPSFVSSLIMLTGIVEHLGNILNSKEQYIEYGK